MTSNNDKKYTPRKKVIGVSCLILLSVIAIAFLMRNRKDEASAIEISRIAQSEELILKLQRHLDDFTASAKNLSVPDWNTKKYFEPEVQIQGLANEKRPVVKHVLDVGTAQWPLEDELQTRKLEEAFLMQPLFSRSRFVDRFKLKIVKGAFQDSESKFSTEVSLSGLAQSQAVDSTISFKGSLQLVWNKSESDGWQIGQWIFHKFEGSENSGPSFFAKVNQEVIPDDSERTEAERCVHEEVIVSLVRTGEANIQADSFPFELAYDTIASHPGVAVVDINSDGWDDFYLMARWGKNKLFVNQGDGTFQEQGEKYGLDIMHHSTSAAFADFDNDGDPDLFLGKNFGRAQYFENLGGLFLDVSKAKVDSPLPAMVTSVTTADYNGDGLLDVFLTTYGVADVARKYLPIEQQKILAEKSASNEKHIILNGLGVPNLLLLNQGYGEFSVAPENSQLELWQTTLSATWVDFDKDGDPDVYITNDFGPDALMRNDFPKGFHDVTNEVGHPTMAGLGMGASWGDYDLDGKQDLYVSNMFSKAGLRITEQIEKIDNRFVMSDFIVKEPGSLN